MTDNPITELPKILSTAIDPFARAFAIDPDVAPLMLLQLCGAILGGSIKTLSPDMVNCTPAFEMVSIHNGRALSNGAVFSAIEGARQAIVEASAPFTSMTRRERKSQYDRFEERHVELSKLIPQLEVEISKATLSGSNQEIANRIMARRSHSFSDPVALQNELKAKRDEQSEIEKTLADLIIALHPEIIRDNGEWRDLVDPGLNTFDGHSLQFASASSLLAELGSRNNRLKACHEVLQRARSESPITGFNSKDTRLRPCVHVSGSFEEFAAIMRRPRISEIGLLDSAVFIELDADEPADPAAMEQFATHRWHSMMWRCLRLRAAGELTELTLDARGIEAYIAFHEWCFQFNQKVPSKRRVHYLRWPGLMIRLATSMSVIAQRTEDGILPVEFMEAAADMLKSHAPRQASLLRRLSNCSPDQAHAEAEVDKLVQRLRLKGPQSRRDLARSYSGQNYDVIDACLFTAIRQGRVVQSGRMYSAADGNVNASMHAGATENQGEVAA